MKDYNIREMGTIEYVAGQRKTLQMDRGGVLMQSNVRLQFTVTNTASSPVGPLYQTLARLIKRLEIIVGGSDTVISVSGHGLAVIAHYDFAAVQDGMDDTVVLTGSAATTYDVTIPICHYLPRGRRPDDAALDLRRVTQATVAITWGDENDLFTTPNAAAISAVTCTVEGEYMMAPQDTPYLVRDLATAEKEITADSNNFQIQLDRMAGGFHRSYTLITTDAKVGENDILNSLKLESGGKVFQNRKGQFIQASNKRNYNLENLVDGTYKVDLHKFGEMTSALNTGALTADLFLTMDVTKGTGTTVVEMVREAARHLGN